MYQVLLILVSTVFQFFNELPSKGKDKIYGVVRLNMWTINQNNQLKDTKKTVENVHIKQELSVGLFLSV